MKKLSIEQLEATVGGTAPKLRTCFLAGIFTAITVGLTLGSANFFGAGAVFVGGLSAANYKGCL